MDYTLVVVDMQHYFPSARKYRVRKNCIREVNNAISSKAGIIILEYQNCGRTLPSITEPLKDYVDHEIKVKPWDNGATQVSEVLNSRNFSKNIRMVGVNTGACVYQTALGLTFNVSSIKIISDACNASSDYCHKDGLERLQRLRNVSIV